MDWITLVLPIAREVRDLVELFQRDNSRAPTNEELEALLRERKAAEAGWADALNRLRS